MASGQVVWEVDRKESATLRARASDEGRALRRGSNRLRARRAVDGE